MDNEGRAKRRNPLHTEGLNCTPSAYITSSHHYPSHNSSIHRTFSIRNSESVLAPQDSPHPAPRPAFLISNFRIMRSTIFIPPTRKHIIFSPCSCHLSRFKLHRPHSSNSILRLKIDTSHIRSQDVPPGMRRWVISPGQLDREPLM